MGCENAGRSFTEGNELYKQPCLPYSPNGRWNLLRVHRKDEMLTLKLAGSGVIYGLTGVAA